MAIRVDLVIRWTLASLVLLVIPTLLLLPIVPAKPWPLPLTSTTTIQLDYREPVPDGDMRALRNRLYAQVQKDCAAAAEAFRRHCAVVAMEITDPRFTGDQTPAVASAHAELALYAESDPIASEVAP